jgi:hypothetical protein
MWAGQEDNRGMARAQLSGGPRSGWAINIGLNEHGRPPQQISVPVLSKPIDWENWDSEEGAFVYDDPAKIRDPQPTFRHGSYYLASGIEPFAYIWRGFAPIVS